MAPKRAPIYPAAAGRIRAEAGGDPEPVIIVDGAGTDRLRAEDLWRKIRDLPFEEQCRGVRGYRFCSTVLFDLLRKMSRQEGRRSRQRGVEIARLALVSLEDSDQVFGEADVAPTPPKLLLDFELREALRPHFVTEKRE